MGFTEVLTIVFIVLKLCDVINWSWWLVWLPEIIMGFIYLVLIIVWFIITTHIRHEDRKIRNFWKD